MSEQNHSGLKTYHLHKGSNYDTKGAPRNISEALFSAINSTGNLFGVGLPPTGKNQGLKMSMLGDLT